MFKESDESFGGKPAAVKTGKTLGMASAPKMPRGNDEGGRFVSRNLVPVKTAEAFVPTPAEPVRMRFKMGGGC
jgi:hypothetical protein